MGPRAAPGPMALSAVSELRAPRGRSASPQPLAGPAAWRHPALQRVPGIQRHQPPSCLPGPAASRGVGSAAGTTEHSASSSPPC